ncbi:hypothetical protein [Micromonospora sp. NBRC 101691]|uniref:hypothetical protein n=1 Tax=Micromonospora sp. NBRC 101691 TaxID=3032198 RepID=UPI002552835B|nr:hypothetical protein [Micromonospora sp. NBRC 101691]
MAGNVVKFESADDALHDRSDQIGFDDVRYAAQEANERYHVSLWNASGDTNGWVGTARVRNC